MSGSLPFFGHIRATLASLFLFDVKAQSLAKNSASGAVFLLSQNIGFFQ